MCPANERHHYKVTPSLIGWVQTKNQPYVHQWAGQSSTEQRVYFVLGDINPLSIANWSLRYKIYQNWNQHITFSEKNADRQKTFKNAVLSSVPFCSRPSVFITNIAFRARPEFYWLQTIECSNKVGIYILWVRYSNKCIVNVGIFLLRFMIQLPWCLSRMLFQPSCSHLYFGPPITSVLTPELFSWNAQLGKQWNLSFQPSGV